MLMYGGECQVLSSSMAESGVGSSAAAPNAGSSSNNIDGGGSPSVEHFFSSPIRNPNFGFLSAMPYHAFNGTIPKEERLVPMGEHEEVDHGSGSGGSGNLDVLSFEEEEHNNQFFLDMKDSHELEDRQQESQHKQSGKKKRFHRHSAEQIQHMEALFKECPHPDDKQRLKLSEALGLRPRQVKFWFQNRRTQMKAKLDRQDNAILRTENERLKNENYRLQAAIGNVICPSCGNPAVLGEMSLDEQHLRIENARLKDELERLKCIASRFIGHPGMHTLALPPPDLHDMNMYPLHFNQQLAVGCADMISSAPSNIADRAAFMCMPVSEQDKPLVLKLAVAAAEQITRMFRAGEPLWVRSGSGPTSEVLDKEEYASMFPWPMEANQQNASALLTEATRDSALVIMNSITLVDAFLDASKWMELFSSVVSKAKTLQVISHGISGHASGCLVLMVAEIMFQSPLVPAREMRFYRYCQHNLERGSWIVVDFPADEIQGSLPTASLITQCRRLPSGCIIQDMPNGYSSVMWVEHIEVEDRPLDSVFSQFVRSGMAFGATRWVSALQQQCERFASFLARNISDLGVIPSLDARMNMMKLSQRMIQTFYRNICASGNHSWTALSDYAGDTIRVTTRTNTEPGQPNGVILTAVSTTWLPYSHHQVFDLLSDFRRKSQLDLIPPGNTLHEIAHIANGSLPKNCLSLLRINAPGNSAHNVELLLQESSTHPIGGSIVVGANIDVDAVQVAMSGDDPSFIALLPTGFLIYPSPASADTTIKIADGTAENIVGGTSPAGCLLTIGVQAMETSVNSSKISLSSVSSINNHMRNVLHQITAAMEGAASSNEQ